MLLGQYLKNKHSDKETGYKLLNLLLPDHTKNTVRNTQCFLFTVLKTGTIRMSIDIPHAILLFWAAILIASWVLCNLYIKILMVLKNFSLSCASEEKRRVHLSLQLALKEKPVHSISFEPAKRTATFLLEEPNKVLTSAHHTTFNCPVDQPRPERTLIKYD